MRGYRNGVSDWVCGCIEDWVGFLCCGWRGGGENFGFSGERSVSDVFGWSVDWKVRIEFFFICWFFVD